MRSEWKETKIADLGHIITGKTPKTANPENYNGSIPFLTPSDDMSVKRVYKTNKTITHIGLAEVKNCLLPENSVCVSCIGSDLGKVVMTSRDTITNQQINSIIPYKKYNSDFIYYAMLILGKKLNFISKTSTAVPIVNKSSFSEYTILVPSLPEQRVIASTLSCFDDKIELNNRLITNLEAQAQAIFKSWFVDFEPFQDGEFIDSDLGLIPKGWRIGMLNDIGTIVGGATPSKSKEEYYTNPGSGIAWITPKDLSINKNKFVLCGELDITELGFNNSSTKIMPKGTILFSSRAPIGYMAIAEGEVCTNQGFKSVVPNEDFGTAFIYYTLKYRLEEIQNLGSGSTFKEVSGNVMKKVVVLIPDAEALKRFNSLCEIIFSKQRNLEKQNQNLTDIRDTLLPKLMSGEIEVPISNNELIENSDCQRRINICQKE